MRCISLISDFGLSDASVAIAKSIVMQHNPHTPLVDISHNVTPHIITEAAYLLARAYTNFEKGSCHIVFAGTFYSRNPVLILAEKDGHYFFAADNGILSLAFGHDPEQVWKCFELQHGASFRQWQYRCAELASLLANQSPTELGLSPYEISNKHHNWPMPVVTDQSVECHVIHIDAYENIVLNITRQQFDAWCHNREFYIDLVNMGRISTISNYYNDVPGDEVLCRFNSAGYLEIAINGGNAAGLLGFRAHNAKQLFYTTVKIFFE